MSGQRLTLYSRLYWVDQWGRYLKLTLLFQPWSQFLGGFLGGASSKKICRPVQETQVTWVQSLGWEDPPGVESGNQSSILAWNIAWTEESGGLQAMGSWESDMTGLLSTPSSSTLIPPMSTCMLASFQCVSSCYTSLNNPLCRKDFSESWTDALSGYSEYANSGQIASTALL